MPISEEANSANIRGRPAYLERPASVGGPGGGGPESLCRLAVGGPGWLLSDQSRSHRLLCFPFFVLFSKMRIFFYSLC